MAGYTATVAAGEDTSAMVSRRMAWLILTVLIILNIVNYMDRMVISVSLEAIKREMGLSDGQIGFMQGIFGVGVGLFILPAGILVDKWSRKKAVALMAAVWSAATLCTGVARNFVVLSLSRFVCGAGEAGFQPGGTTWLAGVFPAKERNRVTGFFYMASIIGVVGGMVLGGMLIEKGSWRTPFYWFGIPGMLIGLLALFLADPAKSDAGEGKKTSIVQDFKGLFKTKSFIWTSAAQGLYNVLGQAAQAWLVVLIMRAYNLAEGDAGKIMGVAIIPAILGPALGGIFADKMQARVPHGRPLFAMLGCILGSLFYAVQFFVAGSVPLSFYIAIVCVAGFFSSAHLSTFQVVNMDVFPSVQRGKAAAFTGFVTFIIFSWIGQMLVGYLSDVIGGGLDGVKYGLLATVPFGIAAAVCSYVCAKHYLKDVRTVNE